MNAYENFIFPTKNVNINNEIGINNIEQYIEYFENYSIVKFKKTNLKNKFIYLDMDGVISDLNASLSKLEGYEDYPLWYHDNISKTLESMEVEDFHKANSIMYYESIKRNLKNKCFEKSPLMPHARTLYKAMELLSNSGYSIRILSSCMKEADTYNTILFQKINWLLSKENYSLKNVIDEAIFTKGSNEKIKYILEHHDKNANFLLIDDLSYNLKDFKENGIEDKFVRYTNIERAIVELTNKTDVDLYNFLGYGLDYYNIPNIQ